MFEDFLSKLSLQNLKEVKQGGTPVGQMDMLWRKLQPMESPLQPVGRLHTGAGKSVRRKERQRRDVVD